VKILSLFLILFAFTINYSAQNIAEVKNEYEIIFSDGIYIEKFDSTNTSINRYTENNQTYLEGNKLTYDYYYEDIHGRRFKFVELEGSLKLDYRERGKAWSFVSIDSLTDNTIDKVELTVEYGIGPMLSSSPDYNQTVISYEFPQVNGEKDYRSSTGVIDNENNVWIHPPRYKFFRILEINPFPFIQAPYELGNKWNWSLTVGSFWADERWKTWENLLDINYEYEIIDKKLIQTEIGELECYIIESTARSYLGKTQLTAYFCIDVGFVKLEYLNIDSTKTVLELIEFNCGVKGKY